MLLKNSAQGCWGAVGLHPAVLVEVRVFAH